MQPKVDLEFKIQKIMNNFKYIIISVSEIGKIDFNWVLETNAETLRISSDGLKTLVKWRTSTTPAFVENLTYKDGPYTHSEILQILEGPEWTESSHNNI
jgi:hypothetical protein